jgi:hypothetical protein
LHEASAACTGLIINPSSAAAAMERVRMESLCGVARGPRLQAHCAQEDERKGLSARSAALEREGIEPSTPAL